MKGLDDYELLLEKSSVKCRYCQKDLSNLPIEYYDHSGGYEVDGFQEKQWLYVTCGCGYQWALGKLKLNKDE